MSLSTRIGWSRVDENATDPFRLVQDALGATWLKNSKATRTDSRCVDRLKRPGTWPARQKRGCAMHKQVKNVNGLRQLPFTQHPDFLYQMGLWG